jgi:glycosyltransferase involved in cell wall biosynthesis
VRKPFHWRSGKDRALAQDKPFDKPRVMQLVLSLSPGGTERLVIEIVRALQPRIDSVVCCLDEPGAWAGELTALGVPVIALGRAPGFHPELSMRLARIMRERQIDVVHCHHYSPYVYGLLAAARANVKVVFTEHGRLSDGKPSRKRAIINPLLSLLGGRICSVSADLKQHMVAEGFPARRIQVVYNGIEIGPRPDSSDRAAARRLLGIPDDAFIAGTVGRLDPVKNLTVMLEAIGFLVSKHPEARAVIIGDGDERARLEARAAELGISGSVQFAGYRKDVRALMPAFDLYVNCSAFEGVSLTILEAMAAGLPVIATPVGGNPEVVIDQETGLIVAGGPEPIADAIAQLLLDSGRRREMGDAGRRRVEQHFSITRMVDAYAGAYLGADQLTPSAPPMAALIP